MHGNVDRILNAAEENLRLAAHRGLETHRRIRLERGFHCVFTAIRIAPTTTCREHAHRRHASADGLVWQRVAVDRDRLLRLDAARQRFAHLEIRDHARRIRQENDEFIRTKLGAHLRRLRIAATAAAVRTVDARRIHHEAIDGRRNGGVTELQLEVGQAVLCAGELELRAFEIRLRLHEFRIELLFNARTLGTCLIKIRLFLRFVLEEGVLLVDLKIEIRLLHFRFGFDHRDTIFFKLVFRNVILLDELLAFLKATLQSIEIDDRGFLRKRELLSLVDDFAFLPTLECELRDAHGDVGLVEFALLFALLDGERLFCRDFRALRAVHLVARILDLVDQLFLRETHHNIALRDARTFRDDLSDHRARLELVANLHLLLRGEFSAHRKHHVEGRFLDGVQVTRADRGLLGWR